MKKAIYFAVFAAGSVLAGQDFGSRIAAIESSKNVRIGVAAFDTATNRRLGYRETERFQMCSTFKVLAVAAVLQRIDHQREKSDRFIRYTAANILKYAPVTREHVAEGGMKLADLCAAAIEQSDNTAANLVLDVVGGSDKVTSFARTLGDRVTRLDRKEPDLNIATPDGLDTTTPAAMNANMEALLGGGTLTPSSRVQLEQWLVNCETGKLMIRAAAPADWKIGDKTGRSGAGAISDIAIIRPPGRKPMFVAIYLDGVSGPPAEGDEIVAMIAKVVFASISAAR